VRYLINEQIYFDMAVETIRFQRLARFKWLKNLLENRQIRIDTMRHNIEMMRDLRVFKRCGRGRP